MSLHPQAAYPIPEDTQRVARAAFPHGNLYMHVADRLGTIYHDAQFAALFPTRGQPAEAPGRLVLATIFQFAEDLSDRQAAEAVRSRIDWKYVLGLELTDPGFHHTVLSEFRTRLVTGEAEQLLLEVLLTLVRAQGLLKTRGRQRTDSTHVLAAIRVLNRLKRVGETLRAALNSLAVVAPDWLQARAPLEWYDRYGSRVENYHLPKTDEARAGTGFDKSQFLVDWDRQVAICPMGKQSISWLPNTYKNGMTWEVRFARKDCTPCLSRAQCTRAKKEPRLLGLQEREQHEALQAARQRQTTAAFHQQYAPRAGIESTHAQGIRRYGLRQTCYIGLAKTITSEYPTGNNRTTHRDSDSH